MSTEIKIFENSQFGKIRAIEQNGEPWFVVKDVCEILELANVTEATRALDDDERGSVILNTFGGSQQVLTISESGLYSLIFKSRKPEARLFRKWVTSEVLPAIRRTGSFSQKAQLEFAHQIIFDGRGKFTIEAIAKPDGATALLISSLAAPPKTPKQPRLGSAYRFFQECALEEPDWNLYVTCNSVYSFYYKWCRKNNERVQNYANFGRELQRQFPNAERMRKWTSSGIRQYVYFGIRLKGDPVKIENLE